MNVIKVLTSFQNCNPEFESASTKLLSTEVWFRSGFQVTFVSFIKMTSGFPLSSPFKFSRSTFKRLLVGAQHFISSCCFGMELPLKDLSQFVPLKFCVFQQTFIRGKVPQLIFEGKCLGTNKYILQWLKKIQSLKNPLSSGIYCF